MYKYKILLIEDEVNLRDTIGEYLKIQNYEVTSAENGQEALDLIDYWIPDLIICDIMMPVMDGHKFHEILSQNKMLNAIPFIFLTAKNSSDIQKKCLLDGADEFISKPFKFDNLIEIIQSKLIKFEKIKKSYNNIFNGSKNVFYNEIDIPINEILETINLLIEKELDYDKNEKKLFYETIKISGARLKRTMHNLMLYQNIKNNRIEIDDEANSDLLLSFGKVKEDIALYSAKQEKRILSEITPAKIKMDSKYLEFILYELIDNALKYSGKTKKINIYGKIFNKDFYELIIIDYGDGLNENEIKQIQAGRQFQEIKKQGLGLGLFLSKVILLKSNGIISINSMEGHNTKVSIIIPLYIDN